MGVGGAWGGCIYQMFAVRNIAEQCLGRNTPLNKLHWCQAFNGVHHENLRNILRANGMPSKIANLIGKLYEWVECSVILDCTLAKSFELQSGERQWCVIYPKLFIIAIDWVMRRTTFHRPPWILNFADNLAAISSKHTYSRNQADSKCVLVRLVYIIINKKKFPSYVHIKASARARKSDISIFSTIVFSTILANL